MLRKSTIKGQKDAEQAEKDAKRQENNQSRVGVRRGLKTDGKTYMSADVGQDQEESKTENEIVCLKLDDYTPV